MQQERFKLVPFVSLILKRGPQVLLIRRLNTGVEDGMYACAGGGVDEHEPVTHAVMREAAEELGIIIKKEHIRVAHILHRRYPHGAEMIGFYVEVSEWDGEPCNMEPDKCDDVRWFDINNLPENCQPSFKQVVDMLGEGAFFSEMGWEE
jgi:ADP-ribose pyrophosphatase YjhB (NUDIX family)